MDFTNYGANKINESKVMNECLKQRVDFHLEPARRCLWLECEYLAAAGSKYCSYECGKKLAKERLIRQAAYIQEDGMKYNFIKEKYKSEIDRMIVVCRNKLENLNKASKCARMLSEFIIKQLNVEYVSKDDEVRASKVFVLCLICGGEIDRNIYGSHIVKCLVKKEKQAYYGSEERGSIAIGILCEQYSSKFKSYCKRLKIICPEHPCKDVDDNLKVCSYPSDLDEEVKKSKDLYFFSLSDKIFNGNKCTNEYGNCCEHPNWYRYTLANIDSYRYGELDQLNECRTLISKYNSFINNRGNVYNSIASEQAMKKFYNDALKNEIKTLDLHQSKNEEKSNKVKLLVPDAEVISSSDED
uniref:CXXC-type zinc finger protein 1 n=1 Tax=Parastrongyloides trichosuri TaxID=131310 RepID=A0A0N4Z6W0_PARTI